MQGIGLSLPTDATVCWHIMPCRLLDCFHVSEGFIASIISVCLPHLLPSGSWSSVVRKTCTYLPNFDHLPLLHTLFLQLCISFLAICINELHSVICYPFPYLPHIFFTCTHFTLCTLHVCTLPVCTYTWMQFTCMHFTCMHLYMYALIPVCTLPYALYLMHFTLCTIPVCTLPYTL